MAATKTKKRIPFRDEQLVALENLHRSIELLMNKRKAELGVTSEEEKEGQPKPASYILPDGEITASQIEMVMLGIDKLARRYTFRVLSRYLNARFIMRRTIDLLLPVDQWETLTGGYKERYVKKELISKDGVHFYVYKDFGWYEGYKGSTQPGATQRILKVFQRLGLDVELHYN